VIFVYVEDVDRAVERATATGAKVILPLTNQFWGDRSGTITDPYGYHWTIATRKEDLTSDEMNRRAEAFFKQAAQQPTRA
jgi:PhnB protein